MFSLLLAVIYIAFISLGLPDSLLGSAWPVMYGELGVPISYMGIVTMIIAGCTIVSSLCSDFVARKFGTGTVTAVSVLMSAAALLGFSVSGSFAMLCVWAVPYGLGAGAVDSALNNYVALHYASRHMSWLHCFWGVGASISPYIMGFCLSAGEGWNFGYLAVSVIQIIISAVIFISLPMWKKRSHKEPDKEENVGAGIISALKTRGVVPVLITFFAYCSVESTTGMWASSYLCEFRGTQEETAAVFASLFYLGITVGRFFCGFISDKLGDTVLIRTGVFVVTSSIILIAIPFQSDIPALAGLVAAGIGCAPIYPSIIHSTPEKFGRGKSQAIIGIQMASAYVGTTFMPPLFGLIADFGGIWLYPLYLILFDIIMLVTSELTGRLKK